MLTRCYSVVCANEVLCHARKFNIQEIIWKLDFVKVFDRISLSYILDFLMKRKFFYKWIG